MWLCVQFISETKVLDKRNFQVGEVCDVLSGDVMPTGSRVMNYDKSCGAKLFSYWVLFQFLSPSFFVWCGNTFLLNSGAQCHSCLDVLRNLKQTLFSTQVTSLDITWSNWAALCVPVGRCVCRHVWVICKHYCRSLRSLGHRGPSFAVSGSCAAWHTAKEDGGSL